MKKKHIVAIAIGTIVLVLIGLSLRPTPVEVEIAAVERGPLKVFVEEEGRTRVRDRYVVSAPVTGHLQRPALEAGDRVEVDAPLFRIFPAPATPLDARTTAEIRERLRAAEASLQGLLAASNFADAELQRVRPLVERGALAARDLEAAETRAESARLQVQEARAIADALRAQLGGHDQVQGGAIVAHAPTGGTILRVFQESEGVIAAGTPVLEMGDIDALEIVTDLLSEDAVQIEVGAEAYLERWGRGAPLPARVRRIEPGGYTKVSALGVEEQRVDVILDFLAPPPALGDGYRVISRIVTYSTDDALLVPQGAVFRAGAQWAVFRVEEGRARLRTVEIGARGTGQVQVLEGLEVGDEVILYPGDRVEDGDLVR